MTKMTQVLPTFKLKEGEGQPQLIVKKYLYAVELGHPTKMVNGGDYYLNEKGKPCYPNDHAKLKPILTGKYLFHLSDEPLKEDELEGLSKGDCFDPVTLESKPNQEIILKRPIPDHVFIMGTDSKKTKNKFYGAAKEYYRWGMHFPASWIHTPQDVGVAVEGKVTFKELLDQIADLRKPFRHVYVVSHAARFGTLSFPLDSGEDSTNWYTVKQAKENGEFTEAAGKLANHLTSDNAIRIRGCNIGQNTDTLNLLASVFGGKCKVSAPTHKQFYQSFDKYKYSGKGKKKKKEIISTTAWQYFSVYWVRFPGKVKKGRKALTAAFEERYDNASPKPGNWRDNVKKAKRLVVYLPAKAMSSLTVWTHPPPPPDENDEKKMKKWRSQVLQFAKKHWVQDFKANEDFKPTSFTGRDGPEDATIDGKQVKAYTYNFEGKKKVKVKVKVKGKVKVKVEEQETTMTIDVPVYPTEDEIVKPEKTRHPHPEWYKWKLTQQPVSKGDQTLFRAQAVLTMYEINVEIREEPEKKEKKGKLIDTDEPNATYYGQSK